MDAFLIKPKPSSQQKPLPLSSAPNKRPLAATAAPTTSKPTKKSKPTKIGGKTVEQHRRALGDAVKGKINVEKWCVAARTHCSIGDVDRAVFEALVRPNAASVTPSTPITAETPVVVAAIHGSAAMGEIFGHSKIKGGTRCGSWTADRGEVVYFPGTREMRVWWTMR